MASYVPKSDHGKDAFDFESESLGRGSTNRHTSYDDVEDDDDDDGFSRRSGGARKGPKSRSSGGPGRLDEDEDEDMRRAMSRRSNRGVRRSSQDSGEEDFTTSSGFSFPREMSRTRSSQAEIEDRFGF